MNMIRNSIAAAIGLSLAVLIVAAGIWFGVLAIVRSATPEAITTTLLASICAGTFGAASVAGLILMLWRERSGEARAVRDYNRERDRAPMLDEHTAAQMLAAWQAMQSAPTEAGGYRQLTPAPLPGRTISVPVVKIGGDARPSGVQPVHVTSTNTDTGTEHTVQLSALMKFAALPTPKRAEWHGKPELYGECLAFFELHGVLDRTPNGGAKWKPEYPLDTRAGWLDQFNQQAAHTPAR